MLTLPAMKGTMGSRECYTVMVPLRDLSRLFKNYVDVKWKNAEAKKGYDLKNAEPQRALDLKRIPGIMDYIDNNLDSWVFSAIVASYNCKPNEVEFESFVKSPFQNGIVIGKLTFHNLSRFIINDGQHRATAISRYLESLEEDSEVFDRLSKQHIPVLLFAAEDNSRQMQVFHDLNNRVKPVTGSLVTAVGTDPLAMITKKLAVSLPIFADKIEVEKASPAKNSDKIFSLGALRSANEKLLGNRFTKSEDGIKKAEEQAIHFWSTLSQVIPPWANLIEEKITLDAFKKRYVCSHAVFMRAIASVGKKLYQMHDQKGVEKSLRKLNHEPNFRRTNGRWKKAIYDENNRIINNKSAEQSSVKFLCELLGISEAKLSSLDDSE